MNNKTIAKKMINQVKSVITDPQAKSLLAAYHVEASFTHFYETHSHIYLVGKDILQSWPNIFHTSRLRLVITRKPVTVLAMDRCLIA